MPVLFSASQTEINLSPSPEFNRGRNHNITTHHIMNTTKTTTSSSQHRSRHPLSKLALGIAIALTPMLLMGATIPAMLDDFSNPKNNSLGFPRMILDDTTSGGTSSSTQLVDEGILTLKGDLVPPRGQPGWVSLIFLLSPDGSPADISQYEGVRLKIRIETGMLSLSVNSTDVVNFDYHAAMVEAHGKEFTEVKIPFSALRRAWSEQTKLNTHAIASVSLVAVGLQRSSFAYAVDEISFY